MNVNVTDGMSSGKGTVVPSGGTCVDRVLLRVRCYGSPESVVAALRRRKLCTGALSYERCDRWLTGFVGFADQVKEPHVICQLSGRAGWRVGCEC